MFQESVGHIFLVLVAAPLDFEVAAHLLELVQHAILCDDDLIPILDPGKFCTLRVLCFLDDVGVAGGDTGIFPGGFIFPICPVSPISVDLAL